MSNTRRIFLIRHGQASWGKRNYDQLSDIGFQQSNVLGHALKRWPNNNGINAFSGTLERQKDTAQTCLHAMGIGPDWTQDSAWNEFNFKNILSCFKPSYRYHGLMVADLRFRFKAEQRFKRIFTQAIKNWVDGKPNARYEETWLEFKARVLDALTTTIETVDKHNTHDGDIMVFTSGGVIGVIVCHLLGLDDSRWRDLSEQIANSSITQLSVNGDEISLVSFNEHSHLRGQHKKLLSFH